MPSYLQYHNAEKLGWVPLGGRPFLDRDLAISTRVRSARNAVGGTVYLIVKLPRPTAYFLWESFTLEHVEERDGVFQAWGPGRQLVPPQRLEGAEFEAFRRACAFFVGFQPIDRHPFTRELERLALTRQADDVTPEAAAFCTRMVGSFPGSGDAHYHRAFAHHRLGDHALARRDAAEALRLGTEYRDDALAILNAAERPTHADAAPAAAR